MVYGEHTHVWSPMILIKVVRNFNYSFITRRVWLEALVEITFLLFDTCSSLLTGLVGLLGHDLHTGLAYLVDVFFVFCFGLSFGFGLGLGSLA